MGIKGRWGRIQYICKVVIKGGPLSFLHLAFTTLKGLHSDQWNYRYWQKKHEGIRKNIPVGKEPFFSIVLIGNGEETGSIDSLKRQDYAGQELIQAEPHTLWGEIVDKAKGGYIGILCRGDQLADDALKQLSWMMAQDCCQNPYLLYSDEDRITDQGKRQEPFFKPDYSPDTLRSFFYMGGFLVLNKELAGKLEYNRKLPVLYGGYLLALEASFLIGKEQVCHIPAVLYHRQRITKTDPLRLGADKEQLFRWYGIAVKMEEVKDCREARVLYELSDRPKVSVIIPSKDNPGLLKVCLDSIRACTYYDNYEILVIDNGSSEENQAQYRQLCQVWEGLCTYHYEPMKFNFSKMCNLGAQKAAGDYYLFLNDDIEILPAKGVDWLERLLGQAVQPHIGAVGAKLLYPSSNKIQHIGAVNYESGPAHILRRFSDDKPLLFGRNRLDYNYSIVSGACFLIQKEKFWQAGGFAEELAVTFNDVDLCFQLLEAGYYHVVRNDVVLYHHESISRGVDSLDSQKFINHIKERERLYLRHPSLVKRDPFYSRNLAQRKYDGSINIENRPEYFEIFSEQGKIGRVKESLFPVDCMIEYAQVEEDRVCIRGFAYSEHIRYNNLNRLYIVLKGEKETLYIKTMKLYNHTISVQREVNKNLCFVEFYTRFSQKSLKEAEYQIGVVIKPFGRKEACLHMTEQILGRSM
ncbi:MAG: glycosyltransferase [Lachnospiraceae bacterium]|nr:glycosyltransferase [Lachnospiraceae bacterium]